MTPKARRARLFKKSRPFIRPLESKDMGWLWAAYKAGSFKLPPELTQEDFTQQILIALEGQSHFLVEDENQKFQSGKGPVGLVGVMAKDGTIEPAVAVFKWATARNVIRGFVAFFQWVKYSNINECVFRAPAKDRLMKRLLDYGVIYPRAMETVYGVRGKKK